MRFVSDGMAALVQRDAVGLWCFVHVLVIAAATALLVTNSRTQGLSWTLWILYYPLLVGGLQALFLRSVVPGSRKPTIVAATCLGLTLAVLLAPNVFYTLLYIFAVVPLFMSEHGTSPWLAGYAAGLAMCSGALTGLVQWFTVRRTWAGAAVLLPLHAVLTLGLSGWPSIWKGLAAMIPQLPAVQPGMEIPIAAAGGMVVAAVSGFGMLRLRQVRPLHEAPVVRPQSRPRPFTSGTRKRRKAG